MKRPEPQVFSSVRHLRRIINKDQREFALLIGCSRHTIESIEQGRLKLSPRLAVTISHATGIDPGWLLANEGSLPMVNRSEQPYYAKRDLKLAHDPDLKSLQFHQVAPMLEIGVAYDVLCLGLKAARKKNMVPQYMLKLKYLVQDMVGPFREIESEVYAGHRSDGKGLLFPRDAKPFLRARSRIREALAEMKVRAKAIRK